MLPARGLVNRRSGAEHRLVAASSGATSSGATSRGRSMNGLKGGLIQMSLKGDTSMSPDQIRERMLAAHLPLIEEAGRKGVQVLCFQEVFTQPYFCPSQDAKWYAAV